MNTFSNLYRRVALYLSSLIPLAVGAVVVTNDTVIGPLTTSYDGQDVVVSNAVLTVDGPHAFNSLRIATGATLTHSAASSGALTVNHSVTNEAHLLVDTNPVTLLNPSVVLASVLVRDTNSLVTYTNDVDYVLVGVDSSLTLQRTTNSFIADGDTVFVSYDYQTSTNSGLNLTLTNDFELETGAIVEVAGRGRFVGPGVGGSGGSPITGAGGGHGGLGGLSSANAASGGGHGSALAPTALGSSGGLGSGGIGGLGGGAVLLTSGGNCVVNGLITCQGQNATNSRAGGGAGGSVWITAQTISGSGLISANGGAGEPIHGGGGGGGRIALDFQTNLFAGNLSASGGAGWQCGGAGSILLRTNGSGGKVTFDNGGSAGAATPLAFTSAVELFVQGRAHAIVTNSQNLTALTVRSNSSVTAAATNNATLSLTVSGNATIEAGAWFTVDGRGSSQNIGTGVGVSSGAVGSGAGHGGYGGSGIAGATVVAGGSYHGSITGPTTFGSGGRGVTSYPGGAGGGAVRLNVNGKLQLDGKISADATAGGALLGGGGSGGSVWLTLGTFAGAGTISANGGSGGSPGNGGGGGGGGRIAVTFSTNLFSGSLTAFGGNGGVPGGAGTIYTKLNSVSLANLRYDNNGLAGTNAMLDISFSCNLLVTGGAALRTPVSSTMFFGSIDIATNSSFAFSNTGGGVNASSNITVAAGGLITSDGLGSGSGSGSGAGQFNATGSGGAGYGGFGGRGLVGAGGNAYGNSATASSTGSGGGGPSSTGGAGGGSTLISCSGLCTVDGRISANGASTATNNAGGGSGGSVRLSLNQFTGSGTIAADGGNGHLPNGGGGGGGRIAITYNSNSFTGNFSARGGLGYNPGGAGTVYLKANNSSYPDWIVDNGGISSSNALTVLDLTSVSNLTIRAGGAISSTVSPLTIIGNLDIQSGSTFFGGGTVTISGSANIAAGGWLTVDGFGGGASGPGATSSSGSGGGAHGGYGGRGAGAAGGNVYDSSFNPIQAGCVGGGVSPPYGGVGGGYVRLNVIGPLTLNGKISANGTGQTNTTSGGGSGGTVYLSLNQFSGSGIVSADGGPGSAISGGGGGGRIAIYYNSNSFAGTFSAKGGNGFQAGGAGTIYLKRNIENLPNLTVDNGGLSGTNTVLDVSSLSNLTVTGGAILKPTSPAQNVTLFTLNIGTNSTLLTPGSGLGLTLNISGAANIAVGGSISGDGLGSAGGSGSGFGQTASAGSGGAGHGGYGGRGIGNAPTGGPGQGGNAYGLLLAPTSPGSGGGGNSLSGGSGGGVIRIIANGQAPFTLDGRISANGLNAFSNNAGGGSGGSVWLTLNQLLGSGVITADGGSGHLPYGGGGGGGRISVSYNYILNGNNPPTNGFTGTFRTRGGSGFTNGGAGTVYLRTNNVSTAVVFVDNGGARGTNTLVTGTGTFDLFVSGGAAATGIGTPRDLFVRSNSFLAQSGSVTVSRNATFDAGGGINLDGLSTFSAGNGNGSSLANPKGGGGHGGYGAQNPASFGGTFGFASSPTSGGSVGGNGSGTSAAPLGGVGGGAVHLTAGDTLTVNGEISADGLNGDLNSGGGSGGSIWLQATTLAGNGQVTATGGNGNNLAGGGGGGRIAINTTTNLFAGTILACGGSGGVAGGAGTIYLRDNSQFSSLLLDNCGWAGTNTPLSSSYGLATNVTVTGGAVAEFQGAIPLFSNLVVGADSYVTTRSADSSLYLGLLGDLTVNSGGGIVVDGKGFTPGTGTGAGAILSNQGAGGGYGGAGGNASSGALGGITYGSMTQPVDRGSGGGTGGGPGSGSEGGGAIRLAVAGTLLADGVISANGATGLQDDSGGGSGGSVWITAGKFTGNGNLAADGGDGDLYGGGGGGGGRIAIYSPLNTFTGLVSVASGAGAFAGGTGTVFTATSLLGFEVASQSPLGGVADAVSQITLGFTDPVNPLSITPDDFKLYTPYGMLDATNFAISFPGPAAVAISFPAQNIPGDYRLETGPAIESLFAVPMSQVFTGAFTSVMPLLSGTVTDTNGQPIAGVTVQPDGGLMSATTDLNGNYSLGVPVNWSGTVTPGFGGFLFAPGSRNYSSVSGDVTNQNYLMVTSITPELSVGNTGANLRLNWNGLPGVTYQVYWSTNLSAPTWLPLDPPVAGTNGVMELQLPISDEPEKYFRLNAQN